MSWEALSGEEKGNTGTVPYQAFDIRPGITFAMFSPQDNEAVALIIDDNRNAAAGFLGISSPEDADGIMSMVRLEGPILEAGDAEVTPFGAADDLAGTRFTVVYPNEVAIYEHVYLNEHYVTWLGHKGTSAGVADTERYEAIKIAPQLYLAAWNEKEAPLQISFLFDFKNRKELAVMFGYDESRGHNIYTTTSSEISEIMHTSMEGAN